MYQAYILFAILLIAMIMFILEIWRYDVIAFVALFAAVFTGIVPFSHVFSGFSNSAVALVAAIMILSKAISSSGFIHYFINWFKLYSKNPILHISIFAFTGAFLAIFMSAIGALGILLPIALQTCVHHKRPPSLILLPLAFGSVLGELITLISSPASILISQYRQQVTGSPFNMFDFTPVGIVVASVGLIYISLIGWRLLPPRGASKIEEEIFQIPDYITEVIITKESPFVDKSIGEVERTSHAEFTIIAHIRGDAKRFSFSRRDKLDVKDILIIETDHANLEKLIDTAKLKLTSDKPLTSEKLSNDDIKLVEAVVAPGSETIGQSAKMLNLRKRYSINLFAISRKNAQFTKNINEVRWQEGDVVLLQGNAETLQETIVGLGLVPLAERAIQIGMDKKDYLLIVTYLGAVIFAAMNVFPAAITFAFAVVLLITMGVIPYRQIYNSIDWSVIFLLGAMIPLGDAMRSTGASDIITQGFILLTNHYPPALALILIMVLTMIVSNFMNYIIAVIVMAPVSLQIAQSLHVNPDAFFMAIVVSAVCAFLTPIAHKANLVVFTPGRYKFYDYLRLGLPLELIVIATAVPMIMYVWPLSSH